MGPRKYKTIAEGIRAAAEMGHSQTSIAKDAQVSQRTISNMARPGTVGSHLQEKVQRVASALKMYGIIVDLPRPGNFGDTRPGRPERHPYLEFADMAAQLTEEDRRIWRGLWHTLTTETAAQVKKHRHVRGKKR